MASMGSVDSIFMICCHSGLSSNRDTSMSATPQLEILKVSKRSGGTTWRTAWMKPTYAYGRYRLAIAPSTTWEFKAVFPRPSDEGLRYSRSEVRKVKVHG